MAEKTLAEIARAAWMNAGNLEDHWEITATAVRDAVLKELDAQSCRRTTMNDYREKAREIARTIPYSDDWSEIVDDMTSAIALALEEAVKAEREKFGESAKADRALVNRAPETGLDPAGFDRFLEAEPYFLGCREEHLKNWDGWIAMVRNGFSGDIHRLGFETILDEAEELDRKVANLRSEIKLYQGFVESMGYEKIDGKHGCIFRERDTRPKDGDAPSAAPLASSPAGEAGSPNSLLEEDSPNV